MPKEITVFRSGGAVWLEIDGQPLPVDWITDVGVHVDADSDQDVVVVTMMADRTHVESHPAPRLDESEVDDGEAEERPATQATGEQLRVSGPT